MSASLSTGLGPTDFVAIFSTIFGDVTSVRASRGLPPLVGMHLGHEHQSREESPPRIVVVPTRNEYRSMQRFGAQPMAGLTAQLNPRVFLLRVCWFEARFWGDETSQARTSGDETALWGSFNTALELEREFIGSLMRHVGNDPALHFDGSDWVQPTDMQRLGRLLVLRFGIETPVTDEPWVTLPYQQTPGGAGVQVQIDEQIALLDGTSTDGGIVTVP